MQISAILYHIDDGSIALPEFQRGYVWNREQVRGLMQALYRRHPVGSLLVWVTKSEGAVIRGDGSLPPGVVKLLLDGQQRVTTLYGIIRGQPPKFFDGNAQAFTGLHFNLDSEVFEFYAPVKMKDDPKWVDVTRVMKEGVGIFISRLYQHPDLHSNMETYVNRLAAIDGINSIDLHVEEVTGEDKTIDVVVEIFNRVNSGGTKLSKGDLALAKVCAGWPEARQEMKATLKRWQQAGYYFSLEWLLRCITAMLTGRAEFSALRDTTGEQFRQGLEQTEKACNYILNMIACRLGLDHDRVLGGRYAFPVMVKYLVDAGGKLRTQQEQDHLLYWYIHTFLWGRYAGSTETVLNQDLSAIEQHEGALDRLVAQIERSRGDLVVRPADFGGYSVGARFYPMLYLLTRVGGARDWGSGLELKAHLLGKGSALQVHHIFPKSLLYKHNYSRAEVNAVGNFCFLTQTSNLEVGDRSPETYLEEIETRLPGALESQWVPMDKSLWKVGRYREFLEARQELLAKAANRFLLSLRESVAEPASKATTDYPTELAAGAPAAITDDPEVDDFLKWIDAKGLPRPEVHFEVCDEATGEVLGYVDLAWVKGIQEGFSQPVAFVKEASNAFIETLNSLGYLVLGSVDRLRRHVEEVLNGGHEQRPWVGLTACAGHMIGTAGRNRRPGVPIPG